MLMQLAMVSRLKNDYFVQLLGYCLEEDNRILVYEYAPKGSLHNILHGILSAVYSSAADFSPSQNSSTLGFSCQSNLICFPS